MENADHPIVPLIYATDILSWGLSKREFIAAQAMAAILSNQKNADDTPETVAALAEAYANALLARLEKS